MEIIGWAAALLGAAYLIVAAFVRWGTHRSIPRAPDGSPKPSVSVVVAARDEEERLPATLRSLKGQTYPAGRWDLTVVDDRSRDRTAAVVREVAQEWPRLKLVQVTVAPPGLGGKQHALAVGIGSTAGEIVLMTDADCIAPETWVEDIVSSFAPGVGLVAGLASCPASRSFWVRLQQADLAHLMGAAWGFIGLGRPFSVIGNNLAILRAAYDEIGGYRSLGFTIAEDCALVQKLARTTGWKVAMAPPRATILTDPTPDIGAFLRQRVRWASVIPSLRGWGLAFMALLMAQRILTVGITLLAAAGLLSWLWPLIAWTATMCGDALVSARMSRVYGIRSLRWLSPLVTLWQGVYHPLVAVRVLLVPLKVQWRGTAYGRAG